MNIWTSEFSIWNSELNICTTDECYRVTWVLSNAHSKFLRRETIDAYLISSYFKCLSLFGVPLSLPFCKTRKQSNGDSPGSGGFGLNAIKAEHVHSKDYFSQYPSSPILKGFLSTISSVTHARRQRGRWLNQNRLHVGFRFRFRSHDPLSTSSLRRIKMPLLIRAKIQTCFNSIR